jgi:hypothetical protein
MGFQGLAFSRIGNRHKGTPVFLSNINQGKLCGFISTASLE